MSEAARVARVDGRTESSGAGRLTGAMLDGIAGGLGRAEMRQRIEAQAREIGELKEQLEAERARAEALSLRLREVEVDCRIKSAILHADRTGRLESIERRWAWEKRRTAERIANEAMPWIWILAAFGLITTQIMRFLGVI